MMPGTLPLLLSNPQTSNSVGRDDGDVRRSIISKSQKQSSKLCFATEESANPKSGAGRTQSKLAKYDQKIAAFKKYLKEPLQDVEDNDKWLKKMLMSKDTVPSIQGDNSMPDLPKITKKRSIVEHQDIRRLGAARNSANTMENQLLNIIQSVTKPEGICTVQTQLSSIQSELTCDRNKPMKALPLLDEIPQRSMSAQKKQHTMMSKLTRYMKGPLQTLPSLPYATANGIPQHAMSAQKNGLVEHHKQHMSKNTRDMNAPMQILPSLPYATANGIPQRAMTAQKKAMAHHKQNVSKLPHDKNEPMKALPPLAPGPKTGGPRRDMSAQKKAMLHPKQHVSKIARDMNETMKALPPLALGTGLPSRNMSAQKKATIKKNKTRRYLEISDLCMPSLSP